MKLKKREPEEPDEPVSVRISIRGDKVLWEDFTHAVKKEDLEKKRRKEKGVRVWDVLKGFIQDYLNKNNKDKT